MHVRDENIEVHITNVYTSNITSKINGYFVINGEKIRFKGIAFGRIGGHNVYVNVSNKAKNMLKRMGYEPDDVLIIVQRKMVEGDVILEGEMM